jgi:hypothetical protein
MMPENRVAERLPRPVLVGVQAADGSAPAADDLLPAPFMTAAPVEHRVSGIILPSPQTSAQADALMDLDPLPLAVEFCELRPCPNPKTREEYRRALQRILAGLGARRLRDMDPAGLSRNDIGRLRSFLFWLVRAKRIYGAARICEDINPRRMNHHHGSQAPLPETSRRRGAAAPRLLNGAKPQGGQHGSPF